MSHKLSPYSEDSSQEENKHWIEYYPKLQQYCRFLAQNTWDGDDIAQETYLKALKYHHQQLSSALLNKIAYHHWVDLLRKRKKEIIEAESDCVNHDVTNHLAEMKNTVDLLVKFFTPKQAVIFMLKEAFQFQTKEIAALLNTTDMSVKASLHRAKKRMVSVDDDSFSVESFWDRELCEELSDLFYQALKNQDPFVLIQSILPLFNGNEPKLVSGHLQRYQTSPSSTLCMAA